MLFLDHASKTFGPPTTPVHALTDVTLRVDTGEMVAVMGPSGSGKSTLVQLAAGLEFPDDGTVRFDGVDLAQDNVRWSRQRRQHIGVVFQRLNLVPALTAIENVMVPLLLDGRRVADARIQAHAALAELEVEDLAELRPEDLSGGQEQRVAIARAIVGERRLILADEPTGALDSATGRDVIELLVERARRGCAVVLVTHDAALASWADRIVLLRDGRIVDPTNPSADPSARTRTGAPA